MPLLLVDSDIFCKLGVAGLLEAALGLFSVGVAGCGRLPALPHMLRRGKLPKLYGQSACDRLIATAETMALAPTPSTAWLDQLASVPRVDPGEAQLFASAAEFSLVVLTGDKRALLAVATVSGFPEALAGRIATLEPVLLALCTQMGDDRVRTAVHPLLSADKTVQVCFSAGNANPRDALQSYFDHLKQAVHPLVLWDPTQRAG